MSNRNKDYEDRKKAQGLKRVPIWIPIDCEAEFKQMAEFCCENREYVPFMVKSTITGKFKKGV